MKTKHINFVILMVLIAAMVLLLTACGGKDDAPDLSEKSFTFEVVNLAGESKTYEITSSRQYVGEALFDEGLIEGEEGPYGLYVMTVDGEYHKYEEDGHYWSFYVDGEYATGGVDVTEIADGASYALKAE